MVIKLPIWGDQTSSKCMVILRDFPVFDSALFGLVSYNDPGQMGSVFESSVVLNGAGNKVNDVTSSTALCAMAFLP